MAGKYEFVFGERSALVERIPDRLVDGLILQLVPSKDYPQVVEPGKFFVVSAEEAWEWLGLDRAGDVACKPKPEWQSLQYTPSPWTWWSSDLSEMVAWFPLFIDDRLYRFQLLQEEEPEEDLRPSGLVCIYGEDIPDGTDLINTVHIEISMEVTKNLAILRDEVFYITISDGERIVSAQKCYGAKDVLLSLLDYRLEFPWIFTALEHPEWLYSLDVALTKSGAEWRTL